MPLVERKRAKIKAFNENCQAHQAENYGPDAPPCLWGGTVAKEVAGIECAAYCGCEVLGKNKVMQGVLLGQGSTYVLTVSRGLCHSFRTACCGGF